MDHSYIHTIILHSRTGRPDKAGCICTCSRTTRSLHCRFACSRTRRCTSSTCRSILSCRSRTCRSKFLSSTGNAITAACGVFVLRDVGFTSEIRWSPSPALQIRIQEAATASLPAGSCKEKSATSCISRRQGANKENWNHKKECPALILNNQEWRHGAMAEDSLNEWTTTQWH